MTPFRVPSTGGTQIGAMWIEQQRAESCRGHGTGEGGQLAAERGGGVAEERYQKNRAKCKERSSLPRCPARLFESRISEKKPSGPELISCDDRDAVRVHNPSSDIGADA